MIVVVGGGVYVNCVIVFYIRRLCESSLPFKRTIMMMMISLYINLVPSPSSSLRASVGLDEDDACLIIEFKYNKVS
jgi:hypothetical protein